MQPHRRDGCRGSNGANRTWRVGWGGARARPRCGRRGAIAASRGRDRFAPACAHRQAVRPISTGRRRGQVFSLVSGALPESGATRDAREARKEPHFRVRSRLSISGGSVCADGFLVGVPFTLQWPPMAVWAHHIHYFRRAGAWNPHTRRRTMAARKHLTNRRASKAASIRRSRSGCGVARPESSRRWDRWATATITRWPRASSPRSSASCSIAYGDLTYTLRICYMRTLTRNSTISLLKMLFVLSGNCGLRF